MTSGNDSDEIGLYQQGEGDVIFTVCKIRQRVVDGFG